MHGVPPMHLIVCMGKLPSKPQPAGRLSNCILNAHAELTLRAAQDQQAGLGWRALRALQAGRQLDDQLRLCFLLQQPLVLKVGMVCDIGGRLLCAFVGRLLDAVRQAFC